MRKAIVYLAVLIAVLTGVKLRGSICPIGENAVFYFNDERGKERVLPDKFEKKYAVYFGLKGESFQLEQTTALEFLKRLEAKKVFCEAGDGFLNEYFYSRLLPDCVVINGKRVNLQISYTSCGKLTVATPINYGGY